MNFGYYALRSAVARFRHSARVGPEAGVRCSARAPCGWWLIVADATEDYLSKAKDAEARAAEAKNPKVKDTWLKIAEGFRHLAGQSKGPSGLG